LKKFVFYFIPILIGFFLFSCREEEELKGNQAPNTTFSIEEINLSGDDRLNSIVRLSWYGKDPDGYVTAYELSEDGQNWNYTQTQDSTFQFSFSTNTDTADIELYVRAIDNEGLRDPSPDYLKIPIKNTPPVVNFDEDLSIPDTTILVATTEWKATDLDGQETITEVLISLNGRDWQNINRTKNIISIAPIDPLANDTTQAQVYYDTEESPSSVILDGLVLNDTNKLFIKVIDQAGTESAVDTSNTFFLKGKRNDVLIAGGVEASSVNPSIFYQNIFNQINVDYDIIDFLAYNGLYRPKIWNITFKLQLSYYDKLFFFSNESTYRNPYTNLSAMLLESAAPSLQSFANAGGKYFISTTFLYTSNIDAFVGVLPVQSKSSTSTLSAVLRQDSSLVSPLSNFPDLQSNSFLLTNIGVYNIDSVDSEVLYEANINRNFSDPWNDTKIIASGRRLNGRLNQVFFNIQLWQMNKDQSKLEDLFDQIFNVEFN